MESPASLTRPLPLHQGFTLVEMLVVLSIIAIITTIALFGQSTFNRSVLLTDAAYTTALSLREMQSLGLSSRRFGSVQNAGYGGRFVGGGTSYTLFADIGGSGAPSTCPVGQAGTPEAKPGNCVYNSGTDGLVRTYTLGRGFRISDVCGTFVSDGVRRCATTDSNLTAIDVVFVRSNTTDTTMTAQRFGSQPLSKAEIYIRDADGVTTRGVCVSQIGQVSIAFGTCP